MDRISRLMVGAPASSACWLAGALALAYTLGVLLGTLGAAVPGGGV